MSLFLTGLVGLFVFFGNDGAARADVEWPVPDWAVAPAPMTSSECRAFHDFAIDSKTLLTDGLVVVKDGRIQFEYYDPKYSAAQPHTMWSVSKTITGALLGTAVRDGKISPDQLLSEFLPQAEGVTNQADYDKIRVSDLFYLDTGFVWDEYYSGDTRNSPVIAMLYGPGKGDMAAYAAHQPMIPQGPEYEWNYSTGSPTLLMGVLKKVYGADYDRMPWVNLFDPLGIKNAVFERDASGTFVGGAYAFLTPRDLARIGYLYLNGGRWQDRQILTADWMKTTLTPSPGYVSAGTVVTDVNDTGVYGGGVWLNRAVKPGLGKPYPNSPDDMFLGIGHFGQFMIVLPSQGMVITRTGYDTEYNSKLDEFISQAISCFADPKHPIGKIIPPPASSKSSIWQDLETLETGLDEEVYEAAVAQSVCACHFVSGVDVDTCIARSNIPGAKLMSSASLETDAVDDSASWLARILSFRFGDKARAVYDVTNPQFGCTLN